METGGHWLPGESIRTGRANGRRRRRTAGRSELECCVTMAHAAPRREGRGRSPGGGGGGRRRVRTTPPPRSPQQKRPMGRAGRSPRGGSQPIRGGSGGRCAKLARAAAASGIGCGRGDLDFEVKPTSEAVRNRPLTAPDPPSAVSPAAPPRSGKKVTDRCEGVGSREGKVPDRLRHC